MIETKGKVQPDGKWPMRRTRQSGLLLLTGLLCVGCSRFPKAPDKPTFKPGQAAAQAMEDYDKDGNGSIDAEEAKAAPGLLAALEKGKIDKNGDGSLDEKEIAERVQYFKTARTTIISGEMQVTYKGRPLTGATVTFTPESFLGDAFTASEGVTNEQGRTTMTGVDSLFPGIYLGFYRVTFSKEKGGKESLPAKFNTETTVGYEATDDDEMVNDIITFNLK